MTVKIDQAALVRIQKKLGKISKFNTAAIEPMEESLALIQDEVAKYPVKNPNAFSQLATPGQRRAFWAKVRSGEAGFREGVGYVRTGKLGQSWTTKIVRSAGKAIAGAYGLRGEVGTNNRYAQWVQSSKYQQPFHGKSRWVTEKLAMGRVQSKVGDIWQAWIRRILSS